LIGSRAFVSHLIAAEHRVETQVPQKPHDVLQHATKQPAFIQAVAS
jgi:hypothetical protein